MIRPPPRPPCRRSGRCHVTLGQCSGETPHDRFQLADTLATICCNSVRDASHQPAHDFFVPTAPRRRPRLSLNDHATWPHHQVLMPPLAIEFTRLRPCLNGIRDEVSPRCHRPGVMPDKARRRPRWAFNRLFHAPAPGSHRPAGWSRIGSEADGSLHTGRRQERTPPCEG